MGTLTHIIHQQEIDLECASDEEARALQSEVSTLYYAQLLPVIEEIFTQLSPGDDTIRLEELELDLGDFTSETLGADLVKRARELLPPILEEKIRLASAQPEVPSAAMSISKQESALQSISYFLVNGSLPWWVPRDNSLSSTQLFEEALKDNTGWMERLLRTELRHERVRKRVVYQFSSKVYDDILQLLVPEDKAFLIEFQEEILRLGKALKMNVRAVEISIRKFCLEIAVTEIMVQQQPWRWFRSWVIQTAKAEKVTEIEWLAKALPHFERQEDTPRAKKQRVPFVYVPTKYLKKVLLRISEQAGVKPSNSRPSPSASKKKKPPRSTPTSDFKAPIWRTTEKEEFYPANAGIVLIWPFIKPFFKSVGLLEGKAFINEAAQMRAVHLLQFLASGREEADPEFDLILNKLLCGIEVEEPIDMEFQLTEAEKAEGEALLNGLIEHWNPKAKMGINMLRGNFLMREGKLTQADTGWELYINDEPYDILKNTLPWGIGTIRLPWNEYMIHVVW